VAAITQRTRDMDPITGQRRIMAVVIQGRLALPFMTGRTTAVLDIGRDTRITFGSLAIGCIEMVRKSGDVVITSCADINKRGGSFSESVGDLKIAVP
jgi:hypothetical protein